VRDSTQIVLQPRTVLVYLYAACPPRCTVCPKYIARVCVTMHRDASLRRLWVSHPDFGSLSRGYQLSLQFIQSAESDPRSHSVASEPRCCHIWPGTLVATQAAKVPAKVPTSQAARADNWPTDEQTRLEERKIDSGQEKPDAKAQSALPVRETPASPRAAVRSSWKGRQADPFSEERRKSGHV
jgi:hypothetical protein